MHDILDLDRYPIHATGSAERAALVNWCQQELAERGMFNLEGFAKPGAIESALADVLPLLRDASFEHNRLHNIYFRDQVDGLEPGHPVLRRFETINHTICGDQLPGNAVCRIYEWPAMARFLADVMEKPALYTMADPLAGTNVMSYREGESLNWHFDRSEFTTTLLLQEPERGGEFQYCTGLRTDDDPRYDRVSSFLDNADREAETLSVSPGTLNVFRGKNTIHRVSPVSGKRDRVITVLSYYEYPDAMFSREEQLGFYGRTTHDQS